MRPLVARRAQGLFVMVCGGLAGACGSDSIDAGAGNPEVVVDTVNGVPRLTSPAGGLWEPGEGWTVGEPVLRLGGANAPLESSWGSVAGAVISGQGVLYVADAQVHEIRTFDLDGVHTGTFGGEGEGPGEFSFIDGLAIAPDGTVAVRDPIGRRLNLFEPDGSLLRSYRLERGARLALDASPDLWIDREHRVFDPFSVQGSDDPDAGTRSIGFVVYDSLGATVDSLETVRWSSTSATLADDEGRQVQFSVPFAPSGSATVTPEGLAVGAVSDAYELHVFAVGAGRIRTLRVDVRPTPLTTADRSGARGDLEAQLDRARRMIDFGGTEVPAIDLPRTRPFLGSLFVDPDGHVWVGEYTLSGGQPSRFDVFDPEGRLLGAVDVPPVEIAHVGTDWIVGIEEDELEAEVVVVLPIVRR